MKMKGDLDMKAAFFAATMAALSFSGVALADGVDGAWKISGDVVGNAIEDVVCTFATAGGKTTASCAGKDAKAPGAAAPATIAGKDVTWDWDAGQAVLTFKGKLDTDKSMKGDIETSGVTGTFTATKQ
jgi:hypothetical protein